MLKQEGSQSAQPVARPLLNLSRKGTTLDTKRFGARLNRITIETRLTGGLGDSPDQHQQ